MPINVSDLFMNIGNFLQSVDWGTFWIAVGAIATSSACIIALWQTKHSNLKKIRLKYGIAFTSEIQDNIYISLDVINIGNRSVIINEWSIPLLKDKKLVFDTRTTLISAKLPEKLGVEESITLYYDFNKFKLALRMYLGQGLLKEKTKIIFNVKDSTGKIYQSITNKKVKYFLENNNES